MELYRKAQYEQSIRWYLRRGNLAAAQRVLMNYGRELGEIPLA